MVRRHASDAALREFEGLLHEGVDDVSAAEELNRRGYRDSRGDPFTRRCVFAIRERLQWPNAIDLQRERLCEQGYLKPPNSAPGSASTRKR